MWEKNPLQMQHALACHDEILRRSVEDHGGYVFKTVGDAFCAAFDTPRQALETTLAAQRALFAQEWGPETTVRVRMALHTGMAEERDGDYFGQPVNRVARIESAGHGGQVLLSAVTYGLVRDALSHLEPGAELTDMGEHRLKDLTHAERIYQLTVPDLPSDFAELKTLDTRSDERYALKELLGSGGMAEVYLAHDEELDRDVAFKVPKNQHVDDEQFVERFKREARNAASLSHTNIAAVYDRGKTNDGAYYIVMECILGGNLKERIQKEGPLPAPEAVSLTLQVARALRVAHEQGMVHRDIKPQNVLLTESGEAKVADFGIARAASSSTITKTGFVMGTAHYISPEQVLGQPATPKSDFYSLGVVLYEMLTGELPHDAETPMGIAMEHVNGRLRSPGEVNPEVPEEVNAVAVRLLARDPEERYQSTAELIEDLERIQRGYEEPSADQREEGGASTEDLAAVSDSPSEGEEERYRVVRPLGSGGMAEVHLARDEELEREVAYKRLRQQYAGDEEVIERFRREAKNAASLSHPNIAAIYDRGRTKDGSYYIVMEYVAGGNLKERIQKEGPLPASEAASMALQVARALEEAHERGMVHRDIKPQNVLLSRRGEAKVADFGIARAVSSTTMTKMGAVMGTAHYLSPEQALGKPATPKSDLYALGVVLYEMLTREVPHDAETPIGIAMQHIQGELRPPREVNPNVPEEINALVVRLMAKEPEQRYQDAAELIDDLKRVLRSLEYRGTTVEQPPGDVAIPKEAEPSTVRVPDLAGQGLPQARGTLAGTSLSLGGQNRAPSETVPKGRIVEQDPAAGTEAERGSPVSVTVSTGSSTIRSPDLAAKRQRESEMRRGPLGSSTIRVPNLAGKSVFLASRTLARRSLKLGGWKEVLSDTRSEGLIIRQTPKAGTEVEQGSLVSVTVSSGPK